MNIVEKYGLKISSTLFEFINKEGGDYSSNVYNIKSAIKNNILYPSLDPSIFEIKYPNNDIKGRVIKP